MKLVLAPIAAMLICMPSVGSANLIVNGSFEDGTFDGNSSTSFNAVATGGTKITGWVATQQGCDWHQAVEFKPAYDGYRMVDLTRGTLLGGISQTFSTSIGSSYEVNFYMAAPKIGFQEPRTAKATVAGNTYQFSTPSSSEYFLEWSKKTFTFTAVATQSTLEFIGNGQFQYWGPVIDNVSIEAVPEPASIAALGAGLALLLRRRKVVL